MIITKMINLPEINKLTQRKRIIMKFHMYKYIVITIQKEKKGNGVQNAQKGYRFCIWIFSGGNHVVCEKTFVPF